jgi:uncharacterized BrkB/YihY/UPF0761 family membrane protein
MIDFRDSVHSMFIDEPDLPRAPNWMRFVLFCVLIVAMFVPLFSTLVTAYFVYQTAKARLKVRSNGVAICMLAVLVVVLAVGLFDIFSIDLKNTNAIYLHIGYSVFCLFGLWLAINLLPRRPR